MYKYFVAENCFEKGSRNIVFVSLSPHQASRVLSAVDLQLSAPSNNENTLITLVYMIF